MPKMLKIFRKKFLLAFNAFEILVAVALVSDPTAYSVPQVSFTSPIVTVSAFDPILVTV